MATPAAVNHSHIQHIYYMPEKAKEQFVNLDKILQNPYSNKNFKLLKEILTDKKSINTIKIINSGLDVLIELSISSGYNKRKNLDKLSDLANKLYDFYVNISEASDSYPFMLLDNSQQEFLINIKKQIAIGIEKVNTVLDITGLINSLNKKPANTIVISDINQIHNNVNGEIKKNLKKSE